MTQASPERNFNSRDDTLLKNTPELTTSDVIIRGEDALGIDTPQYHYTRTYDPDFIGPRDATDVSRGLLVRRAKSLADIAVLKFSAYEGERARLTKAARDSVVGGNLRLSGDYPKMTVDQQVERFVMDVVNDSIRTKDEIDAELEVERTEQNLASRGPEHKLQEEVLRLKKITVEQGDQILKIRTMLIEGGATDEFVRKFDYMTRLMPQPEKEAYEHEMELDPEYEETPQLVDTAQLNLFDMFKSVLSPSFGRKALRSIGIISPKSSEVQVIRQADKPLH